MKTLLRVVVVTFLLLGCGQALRIGVADSLFRRDTKESVKRAARLWPSNAEFEARLADLDPDNARIHLRRAVFLNPSRSRSWISLGLQLELHGNPAEGEQCYLKAAQSDRQFLPAWTLANFYFRRNDAARFWPWARNAAQMSYGDLRPLFRLAFEMSDSVDTVFMRMIVPRRSVEHQFLQELLDRNLDATLIAKRILSNAGAEDVRPLLAWTNRLIETQRVPEARQLWNALGAKGLIPYHRTALIRSRGKIGSSELADESVCPTGACEPIFSGILTNADFSHDPLPEGGFDWRITPPAGVDLGRTAEGLRVEFSGRQPEKFQLLSQSLDVPPGTYWFSYEYRTVDVRGTTNLRWRLGGVSLPPLAAAENWTLSSSEIVAESSPKLVLLEERDPGTMRPEGVVYLRSLKLARDAGSR
jgi:hypothetical protein